MALRILLTAMVVSLSLPLPSVDSCRLLVDEMNKELATVLDGVRDEWSPSNAKSLEVALSEEIAKIGDEASDNTSITEESFSKILDEFANEAVQPEIAQASDHIRKIPVEQVNHPLPPAVEAIDVLPSALELIRSVSAERDAIAVVSESRFWNDIVSERLTEPADPEIVVEMVHPVVSDDIGPWQWLEDEDTIADNESERIAEAHADLELAAQSTDSISEEWECVIRLVSVSDGMPEIEFPATIEPAPASNRDGSKNVTIQDAFRKTAEAIALWSKVMTRTF